MAQPKAEQQASMDTPGFYLSLHLALLRKPGRDAGRCTVFTDSGTIHNLSQWIVQTFLENVIHNARSALTGLVSGKSAGTGPGPIGS